MRRGAPDVHAPAPIGHADPGLTLLNDPAFFEIAGGLAARILEDCAPSATDRERLRHGFRLCLARPPT